MIFTKEQSKLLKGLAILFVLENHCLCQAYGIPLPPLGSVGVFIFLLLSGYGIAYSLYHSGGEYWKKRFVNVYVPYAISIIIYCLWSIYIGKNPTFPYVISWLTLTEQAVPVFWYLQLLAFWYIYIYVFYFLRKSYLTRLSERRIIIVDTCLLLIGSIIISVLKSYERLFIWQFLSFPLGFLIKLNEKNISKWFEYIYKNKIRFLLVVLTIILFGLKKLPYVEAHEIGVIDTILQMLLTIVVGIISISFARWLTQFCVFRRILNFFGALSYELYLGHAIAIIYLYDNPDKLTLYLIITTLSVVVLRIAKKLTLITVKTGGS